VLRRSAALAVVVLSGSTPLADPVEPAANEVLLVATGDEDATFAFEPVELTVDAGTTVRWRNTTGEVFHTITFTDSLDQRVASGVFDAQVFDEGDVVEFTFDEPGTYAYFCQPHSEFMTGTIVVTEPGGGPTTWRWWAAWIAGSVVLTTLAVITARRRRPTVMLR
jgi:plastocyanin